MGKYARMDGSTGVEIFETPEGVAIEQCVHASLVDLFILVDDDVTPGSTLGMMGEWQIAAAHVPGVEPAAEAPKVSPIEFKLLFTSPERVALDAARAGDPIVDDFFKIVDDSRLTVVDLGLKSTRDAVGYLALQGLIAEPRVAEILAGVRQ